MFLLHISDIHFRSPNCLDPDQDPDRPYRTRLLQDVRLLVSEHGPVSAILVGGDIAFKGAAEEYETALVWLRELAAIAGCPQERIYVVPGNHDVDRTAIANQPAVSNAMSAIFSAPPERRESEFRTQISDADTGKSLLLPLAAYNEFAKLFNCQVFLPEHLSWRQDLGLEGGVKLRIHGLTSTILSGLSGDDKRSDLYLSPLQTVLDPVDDVVNLVLCHHPPDWLSDQDDVQDAICRRAPIQLFGHKHRQRIRREVDHVCFSAGAVNPDRNEPGWHPGYNLIEVHIAGEGPQRQLRVGAYLRQWQAATDSFAPVRIDGQDSCVHVVPFPRLGTSPAPSAPPGPTPASREAPEEATVAPDVTNAAEDAEAAMGDASTRNLVFRFWNLTSSCRREIALQLKLIGEADLQLPEAERYGRALLRAGELDILTELARQIARREHKR